EQRIAKQISLARKHHVSPEALPQLYQSLLEEQQQLDDQADSLIRLGSLQYAQVWNGPGFSDTSGYVITGVTNGNSDELIDGVHR
ncbi:hypothetical protein MJI69_30275, partial [Salmonella enterica subsp. enterica serovar Anatum]|nr:hypothetical protein [Salmonella enterica subsp. enterica serovar Anatum]